MCASDENVFCEAIYFVFQYSFLSPEIDVSLTVCTDWVSGSGCGVEAQREENLTAG